jgi:hypothetical protein
MKTSKCAGQHTIFVAEVVAVESSGMVYVLTVCTSCDYANCHAFKVSNEKAALRLLKEEKSK